MLGASQLEVISPHFRITWTKLDLPSRLAPFWTKPQTSGRLSVYRCQKIPSELTPGLILDNFASKRLVFHKSLRTSGDAVMPCQGCIRGPPTVWCLPASPANLRTRRTCRPPAARMCDVDVEVVTSYESWPSKKGIVWGKLYGYGSGWWFGTFFPYIGNNHPNWLSYFSEGWNHQAVYGYVWIQNLMMKQINGIVSSRTPKYVSSGVKPPTSSR